MSYLLRRILQALGIFNKATTRFSKVPLTKKLVPNLKTIRCIPFFYKADVFLQNDLLEDTIMVKFSHVCSYTTDLKRIPIAGFIVGIVLLSLPAISSANEGAMRKVEFSPKYVLNIDPATSELVGKAVVKEVSEFFNEAEMAIESKDIAALMGLYSEGYTNATHRKSDITATWKSIFADFDSLSMTHNMKFVTVDPTSNVVLLRCSGMIVGTNKGDKDLIALDSWTNIDHILVREGGKFRIIGTTGKVQKRLWFDKPLHPLF